jgi:hypothetical protein
MLFSKCGFIAIDSLAIVTTPESGSTICADLAFPVAFHHNHVHQLEFRTTSFASEVGSLSRQRTRVVIYPTTTGYYYYYY